MTKKFAKVILDSFLEKFLDYSIPEELANSIKPGMRIEIPLRNGFQKGYIFELIEKSQFKNLKPINKILSDVVISKDLFSLVIWMSNYYQTPLEKVVKNIIPPAIREEIKPKMRILLTTNKSKNELIKIIRELKQKSTLQAHLLEFFLKHKKKSLYLTELLENLKISRSPIESLVTKKILIKKEVFSDENLLLGEDFFITKPKKLTDEQEISLEKILKSILAKKFETHLIFGVTGSGKTEIYLQAIQKTLELGKSAIMLVPEIALTSQTIERFKSRFKDKLAILHHKRSQGEKYLAWNDIISGKARITIGARSAVFSPSKDLGLIIVDEEHDSSYKQSDEMPTYNARNLAIMRGKFANATVVLGSATPSLESFKNALDKKFTLSTLLNRANSSKLPKVHIVDLKEEIKKTKYFSIFSDKLLSMIKDRYEKGEQTMIFLNKRGYNNFLICTKCSTVIKCKHCDISLTFHKRQNILACHLCNYQTIPKVKCSECNEEKNIAYKGFGTEGVERSLKAIFPEIRTIRIDRDTTSQKHSHEKLFKEFRSGKADVLIGTQMIAKGLHFPSVTLVGVLNTDGALNIPDFRSSENVFQLITQVAGRAGRSDILGEVVIQTFLTDNSIIKLASKQDFPSFYKQEIEIRKIFDFPPFTNLVRIVFTSKDEKIAQNTADNFKKSILKILPKNYEVFSVTACGRHKIKDNFRYQLLIKGKFSKYLSEALKTVKKDFKFSKNFKILIDIDPTSTFF